MKEYPILLRVNESLKDKLKLEADKLGLSVPNYVRMILMKHHN